MDACLRCLVDTADFPARWSCGEWSSAHGWTHIVSDAAIFGAYLAIPTVLIYFIRKRPDIPFSRVFLLFGLFILSCGTGHLMEAVIFWWPAYRVAAVIKVVTAIASWGTVLALVRVTPLALKLPGYKRACEELEGEVAVRRAVEHDLRASESRYRSLVEASSDVVWVADEAGRFVTRQESWEAYTGQPFERHAERKWLDAIRPDDRPAFAKAWAEALQTATMFDLEARLWCDADGAFHRCHFRALPILGDDGAVREWVGAATDLVSFDQAEMRFLSVIEASSSGLVLVREDGLIAMVNATAERMFGFEREDLIGEPIELLVPEAIRDAHPAMREAYQRRPEVRAMGAGRDLRATRQDGTEFAVEVGLNPIEIDGAPHVLCSIVDITARKVAEDRLATYANELARSNSELEDFAHIASHDLKEPLRGIMGYSSILASDYGDGLDEEARSMLKTLHRLSVRMQSFIESLFEFSTVGTKPLETRSTDLGEVVQGVVQSLRPQLVEAGATVRVEGKLPSLECDPKQIGEVFYNLITNAVRFNDKDEPVVEVGWEEDDRTVFVRDNGIGIPDKHREKIFGIFRRLHGRAEYGGGTGAGLTISRKIVERHGGMIWVESEPDVGTTFRFTIDLSSSAPPSDSADTEAAESAA